MFGQCKGRGGAGVWRLFGGPNGRWSYRPVAAQRAARRITALRPPPATGGGAIRRSGTAGWAVIRPGYMRTGADRRSPAVRHRHRERLPALPKHQCRMAPGKSEQMPPSTDCHGSPSKCRWWWWWMDPHRNMVVVGSCSPRPSSPAKMAANFVKPVIAKFEPDHRFNSTFTKQTNFAPKFGRPLLPLVLHGCPPTPPP